METVEEKKLAVKTSYNDFFKKKHQMTGIRADRVDGYSVSLTNCATDWKEEYFPLLSNIYELQHRQKLNSSKTRLSTFFVGAYILHVLKQVPVDFQFFIEKRRMTLLEKGQLSKHAALFK